MNFKKIISFVLAFMMVLTVGASAKTLEFTLGETTAYESADIIEAFEIENAPYVNDNRTMVPVRVISEKFGANVEWVAAANQIVITKNGKTIVLTLGSNQALVDGQTVVLDVVPEVFNGRTMVPLRFISETLGMGVEFVSPTNQIIITDEKPIMKINGVNIYRDDFWSIMVLAGYTPDQEDMLEECINFVTDAFIEVYGCYSYLNSIGVSPIETYSDEVAQIMAPYKNMLVNNCLTAPVAQFMAADCFVTDYVYGYCESEEALDKINETYEKDYVTAKHILLLCDDSNKSSVKKEATKLLGKIKNGADFDTLMNELSEDPGLVQYPDGYTFTYGEMVEEFEKAAFGLKVGEVSDIIETSYGYHIIKREPLAQIDSAMMEYLFENLSMEFYFQLAANASEYASYELYMPTEEIVAMFK